MRLSLRKSREVREEMAAPPEDTPERRAVFARVREMQAVRQRTSHRPLVDWQRRDWDDSADVVTAETVLADYCRPDRGVPRVYAAWIPLYMLTEDLWEDAAELLYEDWTEYSRDGVYPAIKVELFPSTQETTAPNTRSTVVYIRDGNHRVRYWKECGFTEGGAWILDYR